MPEDSAVDRARTIVAEALELDIDLVDISSDIESLRDWTSIRHISIIQYLEAQIKRTLSVDEIVEVINIEGIARVLENEICRPKKICLKPKN